MDDRLLGKRYEKDYTEEALERIYDDITVAVSVPVNVDLEAEHRVLNLSRMEALGISADQVVNILRMENLNLPSGSVKSGSKEVILRTVGEFRNIRQIENVIVASRMGTPIYLKNIADVHDGYEELVEELKMDGIHTVAMMIMKQSGSNTMQVSSRIKERLKLIKKDLPEGWMGWEGMRWVKN